MSLIDDLDAVVPYASCNFGAWVAGRSPEEQAAVWAAIADPDKPLHALLTALRKNGAKAARETLSKHRAKGCEPCRSQTT